MARFSVGVNYWPAGGGPALGAHVDAGAVREDFARMAQLGFDAVRCFVAWDALQPRPDVVDPNVLGTLDTVVGLAAEAGLRVLPTLAGIVHEQRFVPAWAAALPNFYDGAGLEAQVVLARAVAQRLHERAAAIVAWDIGHAFTRVRAPRAGKVTTGEHGSVPVAERELAEWARRLASALREGSLRATAGTWYEDLTTDTNVRPGSLCAPFAFASMQASNLNCPFARDRLDPEALPFLAMVTAAFSFKPVLMTAIGHPGWFVTDDEQAALATAVLQRLHADGRLGAYWWCWRDAAAGGDTAQLASYGIVRADGSEKPVAAALAAFAKTAPEVQRANDMPMISSTYYYRTLPASMTTLYEAFLGFIEPRRAAVQSEGADHD